MKKYIVALLAVGLAAGVVSQNLKIVSATIPDTASASGPIATDGKTVWSLCTDAAFDGSSFTFQASQEGSAIWKDVTDNGGSAVTVTVAASDCSSTGALAADLTGYYRLRLVSSDAQSGGATVVKVALR
jgi:hypothetical protein